jgi:hypothetical protein
VLTGWPYSLGEKSSTGLRSGFRTLSIRVGSISVPSLAIADETIAICRGVTRSEPWPNDCSMRVASSIGRSSRSVGKRLGVTAWGISIESSPKPNAAA